MEREKEFYEHEEFYIKAKTADGAIYTYYELGVPQNYKSLHAIPQTGAQCVTKISRFNYAVQKKEDTLVSLITTGDRPEYTRISNIEKLGLEEVL